MRKRVWQQIGPILSLRQILLQSVLLLLPILAAADDEALLLEAIHKQPAEDTPRLVYADWLEEHGRRDQARFIRAEIAFARAMEADAEIPAGVAAESMAAAQLGIKASLKAWGAESLEVNGVRFSWDRGFPKSVSVMPQELTNDVVARLDALPVVPQLELLPFGAPLFASKYAERVKRLKLLARVGSVVFNTEGLSEGPITQVLNLLSAATDLTLRNSSSNAQVMLRALEASHLARHLKSLTVQALSIWSAQELDALARTGTFSELRALKLDFSNAPLEAFHDLRRLPALRELSIRYPRGTDRLGPFIASPGFRQLQVLHVDGVGTRHLASTLMEGIQSVAHSLVDLKLTSQVFDWSPSDIPPTLKAQIEKNREALSHSHCSYLIHGLAAVTPRQ